MQKNSESTENKTISVFDKIIDGSQVIAEILFLIMLVLINLSTIMRYFFSLPIGWSVETSEFLMVCIVFLSATWVLKMNAHIRVDIILSHLKGKCQNGLFMVTKLVSIVVFGILTYYSGFATYNHYINNIKTVTSFSFPKYMLLLIMTIGFAFLLVQSIRTIRVKYEDMNGEAPSL